MRKQPVLTLTAILALATGIGMATTGFTFVDAVASGRLPFTGGDRFVLLDVYEEPEARRASVETERLLALRRGAPALQYLGALRGGAVNLSLPSGEVALVTATFMTSDAFAVLPYAPLVGRTLTADDGRAGAPAVALLRESVWRKHFSADSRVVGTAAIFSGVQRTIVGVMPDTLQFPTSAEIWLPLDDTTDARIFGVLHAVGTERLATEQLMAVSKRFEHEHSEAWTLRLVAFPFTEVLSRGLDILTAVLLSALIRSALGATRASIIQSIAARTCVPLAIGVVAGPALALVFVSARGMFAFRLPESSGPWGIPGVCAVMIAAGLIATWIPTRRALSISTSDALRGD